MADAPIRATMTQSNVAQAFLATLYVARTHKHVEERKAAEAANRWCLDVIEGIPPIGEWELPEDEKEAIAVALEGVRFEHPDLDEARQWAIKALRRVEVKPPKPPTGLAPPLPHATDFLAAGVRTHPYAGYDPASRQRVRDAMTSRKYTHIYVYAYNERDYGGPSFDYLRNPDGFRPMLEELRGAGLAPVVWLFPDDADTIHNTGTSVLQGLVSNFVPRVDDLVSSYVLGLELDEYWDTNKVNALGSTLRGVTTRPIGVHQTTGQWAFARASWCNYMVLQYGFGKSDDYVRNLTKSCMAALGKPVVAGEYELDNEARGKQLGDVAVAAGATGFGNGGTPRTSPVEPPDPPVGAGLDSPNLLAGSVRPWVPGQLVKIDPAYEGKLAAFCEASPNTQLILSDMNQIPARMREAGFTGRDNALWYTLSRSYAGWNWTFDPSDPDRHLSNQRVELHDFWARYLDVILKVMRAKTNVRALFLLNDGHDKCGDVLSDYSLRQLSSVASRIDRGQVHHGTRKEGEPA